MPTGANTAPPANGKLALGAGAALASVVIWSGWIVFTRHGVTTDVPHATLGLLRFAVPGLVLLPVLLRSFPAYRRAGWLKCAIMIAGSGGPFFLLCAYAMSITPSAHIGVMLPGIMPMFVALLSALLFGERYGGSRLFGYGLVITGVLGLGGANLFLNHGAAWMGHLLLMASAAGWASYTLAFRRSGLTPWQAAALINIVSVPILLAAGWAQGGTAIASVTWQVLMLHGVQQGILSGLIALAAYGYAVATIGASRASAFVSLTPALTALLGAWALGEKLDAASVSAVLLVGVGVALASGVGQEISLKMRALRAQP